MSTAQSEAYARGRALEAAVNKACARYEKQRVAVVAKITNPVQITSTSGSNVTGKLGKRQWCDFMGVMLKDRRAIALECKCTSADRLNLSTVDDHQRKWLDAAEYGFLLVHFSTPNVCRLVAWRGLTTGSVKATDGVRVDAIDWLLPVLDL